MWRILFIAAYLMLLAACGGDKSTNIVSNGGSGASNTTDMVISINQDSAKDAISFQATTDEATATTPSGNASIFIPASALNHTTTITIKQCDASALPGWIGACYEFEPSGTTFFTPVTIKLKYDPSQLPIGLSPQDLTIAYESNGELIDLPDPEIDEVNNTISIKTNHFTPYAVKPKALKYGSILGYYNGIASLSNKGGSDPYDFFGWEYECVEYVNRYYHEIYDYESVDKSWKGTGDAWQYFTKIPKKHRDIIARNNGYTSPPFLGDIIVWNRHNSNKNRGHVAIVRSIDPNNNDVVVIHQNYSQSTLDAHTSLKMNIKNGRYTISGGPGNIIGWLHTYREPNTVVIFDDDDIYLKNTPNMSYNEGFGYLNGYRYAPTISDLGGSYDLGKYTEFGFNSYPGLTEKIDIFAFIPKTNFNKSRRAIYKLETVDNNGNIRDSKTTTIDQSSSNDKWVLIFTDVYLEKSWGVQFKINNVTDESGKYVVYDAIKFAKYPW